MISELILGHLREFGAARAIAAAVADVADDQRVVEEVQGDAGGAHALEPRLPLRAFPDLEVREHHPRDHAVHVRTQIAIDLVGPRQRLLFRRFGEVVADQLYREARRDLAGGVTAHSIGHDREPLVLG